MWHDTQAKFAAALTDPALPYPAQIPPGKEKRFNVYRNNMAVALSEALGATFPVTRALVGDVFFKGMAQVFTRDNLPKTPVLLDYGDTFPDFIQGFQPAQSIPYLADTARLEWAWNRAYHGADGEVLSIRALADLPEDELEQVRLQFQPSLSLLASDWPVGSIWLGHQPHGNLNHLPEGGEKVLIFRPQMTVEVRILPEQSYSFLKILTQGATLGDALNFIENEENFDQAAHLAALFEIGAVTGFSKNTSA